MVVTLRGKETITTYAEYPYVVMKTCMSVLVVIISTVVGTIEEHTCCT